MRTLKTYLSKKDILSIQDLDAKEIHSILDLADKLKKSLHQSKKKGTRPLSQPLKGKVLGMIFQKPSTRTRISFEVGMYQLGGDAVYLSTNDIQLSRGESMEDTGHTLSLYLDCIMARVYDHSDIQRLARSSSVPVINGLSDLFHPCQVLADLLTIREYKKKLKGLTVAWIGDGDNVCNDLMLGCAKTGIRMVVACPKQYRPPDEIVRLATKASELYGAEITITEDPAVAAKDADVVTTDTFVSIGKEEERTSREATFLPRYQVNSELMKLAKQDAIFMHCLPAKRGKEVTSDVIDGKASAVWDEAENRLHVQKALLCMLMKARL
jgi:ornithine carbamoyltransferase